MAITKFLARDFIATVSLLGTVFTHVGGVESIAHSPSKTETDTTDWDSNGRAEHLVAQRAETWTLAGFFLEDEATGARDPGQEILLNAGRQVGAAAMLYLRLTFPGSGTETFLCSVDWTGPTGGKNDVAKYQAVLSVSGAPVFTGVS